MKKVVLSLAFVAAVLVSCNKKGGEGDATDSTAMNQDSTEVSSDSTNVVDSATTTVTDSATMSTDSATGKAE